jgi:heptosyltransferase-1
VARVLADISAQRIAIIKPSALGDVVQALPLLPALRRRFPGGWIAWIVQRELRDLVAGHPDLDEVLTIERRPSVVQAARFLAELRRRRFDLVFDLQGLFRSAVMTWATGAAWRIGLQTAREGAHRAVNITLDDTGRDVPAYRRYWRVAEALGVGDAPRRLLLAVSAADVREAHRLVDGLPSPVFAVQWGARWETKRWPLAGIVNVLAQAGRTWGASVIFVGGHGERAACAHAAAVLSRTVPGMCVRNLAGETTLKQLAAVLTTVDALLGNDSGPLHLAAELGTPVVGIFTCTSAIRSGPPGTAHEFVSTQLPCAASYHKRCPWSGARHLACHGELTPARVWEALVRLVERHGLARQPATRAA